MGCVVGAVIIGTGGTAAAAEVALLGSTAASQVFTDCVKGALLTGALGMLLKVDPPDPDFRAVGYPEAIPGAKGKRCRLRRGCEELNRAARRMASTGRRSASLVEAAAVAGNRYGNAVTARDARVQHVQRAAFTILLNLAADLDEQRAAGIAQVREGGAQARPAQAASARAETRQGPGGGAGPPGAQAPGDRAAPTPSASCAASSQAASVSIYSKALRAAARTSAAHGGTRGAPAVDLPLLVLAIADQEGARSAGLDAGLQALASCDEGAATATRDTLEVTGRQARADRRARAG